MFYKESVFFHYRLVSPIEAVKVILPTFDNSRKIQFSEFVYSVSYS
jgi:hypothetical protein